MDPQPRLENFITKESARKVFNDVFDEESVLALHALASKGYFDTLERLINEGKEAHVYLALDAAGNVRAVKMFKVKTTDFKKMAPYLEGDARFEGIGKNRRDVVHAWTRKEYKNLERLSAAGVRAPRPVAFRANVLVMEFIGTGEEAAARARDAPPQNVQAWYDVLAEALGRMVNIAKLVHSDLSEYNILNYEGAPVIIDVGQGVLTSHPRAEEFFERDLANLAKWFTKLGLKKSAKELRVDAKEAVKAI